VRPDRDDEPADGRRDHRLEAERPRVDPDLDAPAPAGTARPARPLVWVAIAVGGILGTLARYGVSRAIHVAPGSFPWSTFTVNVTGSFVLGALLTLVIERWPPTQYVRPFAAIGFLGSYTTFSTWMVEADVLIKDGYAGIAIAYLAASLVVGLAAVAAGILVARPHRPGRPGSA
jgi:fluoride exporter